MYVLNNPKNEKESLGFYHINKLMGDALTLANGLKM